MDADRATDDLARRNLAAFGDMTSYCEGTDGPDAYFVLFGHTKKVPKLFVLPANGDHPRLRFYFDGGKDYTTAAGKYQITEQTWDRFLKARGAWCAFDQTGQDECFAWLIDRQGALADVFAGRITHAVPMCAPVWASFPGGPYTQPQRSIEFCLIHYQQAGGVVA